MNFEIPPIKTKKENAQEKFEQTGEKIAEGRGNLFARITKRVLERREEGGQKILNVGETEKRIVSKIKEIPVISGAVTSFEGVMGVEFGKPGSASRKLNTKESLVKYGLGAVMMLKGALEIKEQAKIGKKPENILSAKTLEWLENTTRRKEEKNPGEKSVKILKAICNFFKNNPDLVVHFENKINQAIKT